MEIQTAKIPSKLSEISHACMQHTDFLEGHGFLNGSMQFHGTYKAVVQLKRYFCGSH